MSEQELPRLSKDAISQSIQTKSGRSVLLMKVPNLNLFVITDCNNFGSNWIEVSFSNKVYTTRYLMGENEDLFSVIARRFAQDIIESNKQPPKSDKEAPEDEEDENEFQDLAPRTVMLNIALRNTEPAEICEIGGLLRSFA